jgi:type IV pilus assembly protein PilE
MRKSTGFTLIELMIVVAIVAILSAIALPSYSRYVARGKITEAVTALSDYRVKMEQYFQDNRNYGTAASACPVAVSTSINFTYSCVVGSGNPSVGYTATATSMLGSMGSATGNYTYAINESNAKSTSKFNGNTLTKACWLIRGDEC